MEGRELRREVVVYEERRWDKLDSRELGIAIVTIM